MRKKLTRALPMMVIAGLMVAIPASTQILTNSTDAGQAGVNLPLLLLVNRMELTTEQMQEMRDILLGLQAAQESQQTRMAAFEEEMIAFNGSAEELDDRLEAFRLESQEQAELAREEWVGALESLGELLTFNQGEILQGALPGLLGSSGCVQIGERMPMGRMQGPAGAEPGSLRTRMMGQLGQRFEGLRERFGQYLGDSTDSDEDTTAGFRGRVSIQINGQRVERELGGETAMGAMIRNLGQGIAVRHLRSGVLDQLIDVLTLKLEARE